VEGSYPPFSRLDPDGVVRGFDIDIGTALCARLKATCEWVQLPFDGMIPALQAGKIDAVIASMTITEARSKQVAFTVKYYQSPAQFLVKRGTRLEATPQGLAGQRIGVQRGTTHDRFATEVFAAATIVRYNKQDDVFLDLIAGRLTAVLADSVVAGESFLKSKRGRQFELTGPTFTDPRYFGTGAGIALRHADAALKAELNAAIAALRADGTYRQIQDRYFEFDIYGAIPGEGSR
ncbi:MAG: transporter substrate-binding domain-containing protein, partial [Betaproteobacteria bacterium]|nr:transporter substrate-binding domain-containing protein [Betaproteobacteria bacterium]